MIFPLSLSGFDMWYSTPSKSENRGNTKDETSTFTFCHTNFKAHALILLLDRTKQSTSQLVDYILSNRFSGNDDEASGVYMIGNYYNTWGNYRTL